MFFKNTIKKGSIPEEEKPLVLLVDDEEQNLVVLAGALKKQCRTISCISGEEALSFISQMENTAELKVIISDQRMPGMSGVEFFLKVKDIVPEAVRIILTAYTDVSDIIDSINKANIYKFLRKPFENNELRLTVKRASEVFDMRQKLIESEKIKSDFVNTVRHELRTPMNGIQAGLELLKLKLNNNGIEEINIVEDSAKQMMEMLSSILDFSVYDSGSYVIETLTVDIANVFSEIINNYKDAANSKGLEFNYTLPRGEQLIEFDVDNFKKVTEHLLSNAVKFTAEGVVTLDLKLDTKNKDKDTPNITLTIRDTGIGISEGIQEKIFDIFCQADGSFSRRYGGLGIGLASAKKLCELMNGEIQVKSAEGAGSEFRVTVPVEISSLKNKQLDSRSEQTSRNVSKKIKVAVVEDNPTNQLIMKKILDRLGLESTVSSNGKEFIDSIEEQEYDIVFMDCQMPIMDGFEATRKLREGASKNRDVPVVACTANISFEDKQRCSDIGMSGFVGKPVSIKSITKELSEHCHTYSSVDYKGGGYEPV